ncbi:MAG: aldehyde dehydrogenase [Myxococcales bacterium]|nr:aldehyde dehydrogenase [Myxococcales bacterium]
MAHPPTTHQEIDQYLLELGEASDELIGLGLDERIAMVGEMRDRIYTIADKWVRAATEHKGMPNSSWVYGEELLGGPVILCRCLRLFENSLRDIRDTGKPRLPKNAIEERDGRVYVRVLPADRYDRLMFQGFRAEALLNSSADKDSVEENMGLAYAPENRPTPGISLVLGAGNVASIAPLDVVDKIFLEHQTCILKMNPVNDYLGPLIEEAFDPLVRRNFLRVVYGAGDVGAYLCNHASISSIHITGSHHTHDAIVWGPPGPEREERKASGNPINTKPITSELGNVSPVIVVPGPWTAKDLSTQAVNVVTMLGNNGGFNCNAARVLIQHKSWSLRSSFRDEIIRTFQSVPNRVAYYPGAEERFDAFIADHPNAQQIGERSNGTLPWGIIPDVDPDGEDEICFQTEAFCSIFAETGLEADDPIAFLKNAVSFCNNRLWGTLNACILIHPETAASPAMAEALEQAIRDLRYGAVGINHWPAMCFALGTTPWGAYPGSTLEDIQSGLGFVHNTFMLENVEKAVIRGPFRPAPFPPWFVTHRRMKQVAKSMLEMEYCPSFTKVPKLAWHALHP